MNDPRKHHRRSIRLQGYDYSQAGAYFITICTHGREYLFGEIVDGEMMLNELGRIVQEEWEKTPAIRLEIELDEFVVMPDHIHGIVIIRESPGGGDDVGNHVGAYCDDVGDHVVAHGDDVGNHVGAYGDDVGNHVGAYCDDVGDHVGAYCDDVGNRVGAYGNDVGNHVGAYCHTPLHTPHQNNHTPFRSPTKTIGSMVRGFKAASTRSINARRFSPGAPVWQRNYYEHIIRNDAEWKQIREYIEYNPICWKEDSEYPDGKT